MALNHTDSLSTWLTWIELQHPKNIAMGLQRTREVATRLNVLRPRARVITVAGTNGKGSSVSMIEHGLTSLGHSTLTYTSPHFLNFNERLRHNQTPCDDNAIVSAFMAIRDAANEIPLTYFEYSTLAALWLTQRLDVDYLVLEVGLGGRLDAVNIMDADFALLTNVGLDHQDILGNTRDAIGREKAGVFRAGRLALVGEAAPVPSVRTTANDIGANLVVAGEQYTFQQHGDTWSWSGAGMELTAIPLPNMPMPLANAAAVLYLFTQLCVLSHRAFSRLANQIMQTTMPGRFQHVAQGKHSYYLDVAHNAESAAVFAGNIKRLTVPSPIHLVIGMLADKPVEQVARTILEHIPETTPIYWHAVSLADVQRGLSNDALAQRLASVIDQRCRITSHVTINEACRAAQILQTELAPIFIFGSFYTVSKGLDQLGVSVCFN